MTALARIEAAGFTVKLKGNGNLGVSPSDNLTETQIAYLMAHKAEIIAELTAANDQGITETVAAYLTGWLSHIGETDQVIIDDVLAQITNDTGALAYFLKRAEEAKIFNQPNTLVQCGNCLNFVSFYNHGKASGICKAGVMPSGVCHWSEKQHACDKYQFNH